MLSLREIFKLASLSLGRCNWKGAVSTSMPKDDKHGDGPSNFDSSIGILSFLNTDNRISFCLSAKFKLLATKIISSR